MRRLSVVLLILFRLAATSAAPCPDDLSKKHDSSGAVSAQIAPVNY